MRLRTEEARSERGRKQYGGERNGSKRLETLLCIKREGPKKDAIPSSDSGQIPSNIHTIPLFTTQLLIKVFIAGESYSQTYPTSKRLDAFGYPKIIKRGGLCRRRSAALQRTQNIKALRVLNTALNKGFKLRLDKDKQQKKELHLSVDII